MDFNELQRIRRMTPEDLPAMQQLYNNKRGFPLLHSLEERSTFRAQCQTEFASRDTLSYNAKLMGCLVHLKEALRKRSEPAVVEGERMRQMILIC